MEYFRMSTIKKDFSLNISVLEEERDLYIQIMDAVLRNFDRDTSDELPWFWVDIDSDGQFLLKWKFKLSDGTELRGCTQTGVYKHAKEEKERDTQGV